jgi:hypothetical protein
MSDTEKKVTDSLMAHKRFLRAVEQFLAAVRMHDGEVWIGEVCLGSPNEPWVRAPLRCDSAALVDVSVNHAEALAADVTNSLERALQITRDTSRRLQGEGTVPEADLARVNDRNQALERLRDGLAVAAALSPLACHPARLSRWYEILGGSFVPGNPAVEVRVVTTYLV